jgi:hypothetical protein
MSKQTAVEWLASYIKGITDLNCDEIIEQAKAMHKQEIVKAFDEGQECEYQYHINSEPKYNSETFYNETYGGQDESK